MGCWDIGSYDNDTCMDLLSPEYGSEEEIPSAKGLEKILKRIPSKADPDFDDRRELYLGVVVWGLDHNIVVSRKRLQHAMKCALSLMTDDEYLSCFKDSDARCHMLNAECQQIRRWLELSPKEFKIQKALGSI